MQFESNDQVEKKDVKIWTFLIFKVYGSNRIQNTLNHIVSLQLFNWTSQLIIACQARCHKRQWVAGLGVYSHQFEVEQETVDRRSRGLFSLVRSGTRDSG